MTQSRAVGLQRVERQLPVGRGAHLEALELEKALEHLARVGIVFDDHDGSHRCVRRNAGRGPP